MRYGDTAGCPVIRTMLEPYAVSAPEPGTLATRLKPGDAVNPGTMVARIQNGKQKIEVRSDVPGTLDRWVAENGSAVSAGQPLVLLSPSSELVWEALRALYLIGQPEDLPAVERYARGAGDMPDNVRQQATLAARAIRARSAAQR